MNITNALEYLDSIFDNRTQPSNKSRKCMLIPSSGYALRNGPYEVLNLDEETMFSQCEEFIADCTGQLLVFATNRPLTGSTPVMGAAKAAEFLARASMIPKNSPIACLDARCVRADGASLPDGIDVIYDDMGLFGKTPIIQPGDLVPGKRGMLVWNGDVPSFIDEALKAMRDEELRLNQTNRITDEADCLFQVESQQASFIQSNFYSGMAKALVDLSYGTLSYAELPPDKPVSSDCDSAKWFMANVIFPSLRNPSFEDYGFACNMAKVSNLIAVWKGLEEKYGFSIRFSTKKSDYSGILELGRLIGADSAVQAVASGVLPEDVLA